MMQLKVLGSWSRMILMNLLLLLVMRLIIGYVGLSEDYFSHSSVWASYKFYLSLGISLFFQLILSASTLPLNLYRSNPDAEYLFYHPKTGIVLKLGMLLVSIVLIYLGSTQGPDIGVEPKNYTIGEIIVTVIAGFLIFGWLFMLLLGIVKILKNGMDEIFISDELIKWKDNDLGDFEIYKTSIESISCIYENSAKYPKLIAFNFLDEANQQFKFDLRKSSLEPYGVKILEVLKLHSYPIVNSNA